jgi:hypothetical protein
LLSTTPKRKHSVPLFSQHDSSKANRQSLVEESAKAKLNARELSRLERQRKLAETLRLKADAEERGEDVERHKNWEYTIEDNDNWEKKLARKKRRADFEFHGEENKHSLHLVLRLGSYLAFSKMQDNPPGASINGI